MLDILASAKAKRISPEGIYDIEAAIEYALAAVAEGYYSRAKVKSWPEAYNYAASYLAPDEGASLVIKRLKSNYPAILEISADANINKISRDYFFKLIKRKDPQAVVQAFVNLRRWREKDSEVSSWANAMVTSLVHEYNMGTRPGPGGTCICPSCETEMPHTPGVPCTEFPCPDCGTMMIRKEAIADLIIPGDDLSTDESPRPLEQTPPKIEKPVEDIEGEEPQIDGNCVCPKCGYTIPHAVDGLACGLCPRCPGVQMEFQPTAQATAKKKLDKSAIKALKKLKIKNGKKN